MRGQAYHVRLDFILFFLLSTDYPRYKHNEGVFPPCRFNTTYRLPCTKHKTEGFSTHHQPPPLHDMQVRGVFPLQHVTTPSLAYVSLAHVTNPLTCMQRKTEGSTWTTTMTRGMRVYNVCLYYIYVFVLPTDYPTPISPISRQQGLVIESPVRSGYLMPKGPNQDPNRLGLWSKPKIT